MAIILDQPPQPSMTTLCDHPLQPSVTILCNPLWPSSTTLCDHPPQPSVTIIHNPLWHSMTCATTLCNPPQPPSMILCNYPCNHPLSPSMTLCNPAQPASMTLHNQKTFCNAAQPPSMTLCPPNPPNMLQLTLNTQNLHSGYSLQQGCNMKAQNVIITKHTRSTESHQLHFENENICRNSWQFIWVFYDKQLVVSAKSGRCKSEF